MEFEFLAENFEFVTPLLLRALSTHPTLPILSNFLLEAKKEGVYVSATDLEQGIQCFLPAKVIKEGTTTIPGKQFLEVISSIIKGRVVINQEKEELYLTTADGNKAIFQTIVKEEFPSLFEEEGEIIMTLTSKEIKKDLSKVVFAASIEESRPELTGVLVSQKEGETHFVATDGFRLSLLAKKGEREKKEILIPSKLITELISFKGGEDVEVFIFEKGNQVIFKTQNVKIIGRLINGEFPNYTRVIPKNYKTKIVLEKEGFLQKVRLAAIFARENANIIKININSSKLTMFAKSQGVGEGNVDMDVEQEGEDNEIAFNVKFLLDLLKNIEGETIIMEMNSPIEPALFKTEKDKNFLHVIMPVRIQE